MANVNSFNTNQFFQCIFLGSSSTAVFLDLGTTHCKLRVMLMLLALGLLAGLQGPQGGQGMERRLAKRKATHQTPSSSDPQGNTVVFLHIHFLSSKPQKS